MGIAYGGTDREFRESKHFLSAQSTHPPNFDAFRIPPGCRRGVEYIGERKIALLC